MKAIEAFACYRRSVDLIKVKLNIKCVRTTLNKQNNILRCVVKLLKMFKNINYVGVFDILSFRIICCIW